MHIIWLILTSVAASKVSFSYFAENIAVIAAAGEANAIVSATSIVPRIPTIYIMPSAIRGNSNSFKTLDSIAPLSRKPLRISLFDKWYPIIIIGSGVLSPAKKFIGFFITSGTGRENRKTIIPAAMAIMLGLKAKHFGLILLLLPLIRYTPKLHTTRLKTATTDEP